MFDQELVRLKFFGMKLHQDQSMVVKLFVLNQYKTMESIEQQNSGGRC